MRETSAHVARATIAAHILGGGGPPRTLGAVTLHDHQVHGTERIRRLLDAQGGALLADDVGLGKTYVALAVARDAGEVLVIAPAALRHDWDRAAAAARVPVHVVSFEQLARGTRSAVRPCLVIVDEAHHLRSSGTKRFAAAAAACATAQVLLLSATPVQNRVGDLRTLLSLFLGEGAHALAPDQLATYVVRRTEDALRVPIGLPTVMAPAWLEPVDDADCLDRLLALPRPVPPRDGDDGGVLLTYTLARQWASSRAALRGALRRRLARAYAMEDALGDGRLPTQAELASWCYADGAQQLTLTDLVVSAATGDAAALLAQLRLHARAVRELLDWLDGTPDPDVRRAALLRRQLRAHPGERMLAFSEYADTVTAMYRLLAHDERCAMLTHAGGRVAGGAISRRELLDRFAPGGAERAAAAVRIDLLLSTDVLSEGVSLHDASVVVHLDLAWNPARLEQRVGRVRRIGARHDTVAVYVMPPPAPAERLLELERRLQAKVNAASRAVGIAGTILPGLAAGEPSPVAHEEEVHARLREWPRKDAADDPVVAAVRAPVRGALVCLRAGRAGTLLAITPGRVDRATDRVLGLLRHAGGGDVPVDATRLREVRAAAEQWVRRHAVSDVVDLSALRVAQSRRALLRRVEGIAHRTPRHLQSALAPLVQVVRTAATARLTAGAERVLDELARAPMADDAWLRALGEFAALHARDGGETPPAIAAVLLLEPDP